MHADYSRGMKKKSSLGCLFWVALVLLFIVIFLFNKKNIENILNKTNFLNAITKKESVKPPDVTIKKAEKTKPETQKQSSGKEQVTITVAPSEEEKNTENKTPANLKKEKYSLRKARIFFALVEKNGKIALKGEIKNIRYKDSPLKQTIKTLLQGPDSAELNRGFITLIPKSTKLLNIYVKDDTAYLDFTENFRFNSLGIQGLKTQLKQIVYTTTEFSNITKVQILINGKKVEYLGPEGVYIGKPLTRETFENNEF